MNAAFASTPLGPILYRAAGSGRPLLLLHPAPRSSLVYAPLMRALTNEDGLRAIAVDLPGFGGSCDLPDGTSMEGIADAIVSFLDALGLERVDVFGLHSGNKVGAALAANHPTKVARFVFCGMTHSIIQQSELRNEAMRAYVRDKAEVNVERDPERFHAERVDRRNARGYDALYRANFAFDLAAAFARVQARTLVIELVPPGEAHVVRQAAAVCALMARSSTLELPAGDDELLNERPELLARSIRRFLAEKGIEE